MKIKYLLESIDHGTVVLPEFQRGYVWSRNQVKSLFQSLYQRFPVGSLLTWSTRADETELRGSSVSGSDNVKLLLDGQQRVTSLYGVLRGKPPQFFEDAERAKAFTGLYFNLESETFEFHAKTKMAANPLWVSVTNLMTNGPESVTEKLADDESISKKDYNRYVSCAHWLYGIREIELHNEDISGNDKTIDVVVDIFNRVNSGGTKLSKSDLALARICAIRPDAREELRGAIKRWYDAGFDFKLDWFMRCVNVVATDTARFEEMNNLSAEDFGVAVKRAEQAIDFLLNLVSNRLGLDHDRVLFGKYVFPVMVKFVVDTGGSINDTFTQNRLLFWYLYQGMWGRYSVSIESIIDRDLNVLKEQGLDGLINEIEKSRGTLQVRPEDFEGWSVKHRFYPVLYMLTRISDSKDFCTGLPLSKHLLGKGSNLELHHIFPKALLYEAGYSEPQVNAVANFAFLTESSNRKLGKQPPEDYLADVDQNHDGVLMSQWVPQDISLRSTDRYLDFLDMRRQLLAQSTNELLTGLQQGKLSNTHMTGRTAARISDEADATLRSLSDWCAKLGLARPDIYSEIVDDKTGKPLVYPDAVWPEGMQHGLGDKVALLLEPHKESESRLGELGYRFFTSYQALEHYIQEVLDIELENVIVPEYFFNLGALIATGESKTVEYKSTARWDLRANKVNKNLVHAVTKTVCGFLNAGGGVLLIGVEDNGNIIGLSNDMRTLGDKANRDSYERFIRDHLNNSLSVSIAGTIDIDFQEDSGADVCIVRVKASDRPVFSIPEQGGNEPSEFWVREGNLTRKLSGDRMLKYQSRRWE